MSEDDFSTTSSAPYYPNYNTHQQFMGLNVSIPQQQQQVDPYMMMSSNTYQPQQQILYNLPPQQQQNVSIAQAPALAAVRGGGSGGEGSMIGRATQNNVTNHTTSTNHTTPTNHTNHTTSTNHTTPTNHTNHQSSPTSTVQSNTSSPVNNSTDTRAANKYSGQQLTSKASEKVLVDLGQKPDEEQIYETIVSLIWGGTLKDILSTSFVIDSKELAARFQTPIKNVDKLLKSLGNDSPSSEGGGQISTNSLRSIFIGRVQIARASLTGLRGVPLGVTADGEIQDWNHIYRPHSDKERVMVKLVEGQNINPIEEEYVMDKLDIIQSKTYLTFGHVSAEDFEKDIQWPLVGEDETTCKVSQGSVLNAVVARNSSQLMNECGWSGETEYLKDVKMYRYPMAVIAAALVRYRLQIDPLRGKCGIYNLSNGLKFSIVPFSYSTNGDPTVGTIYNSKSRDTLLAESGLISIDLKITYSFPRSSSGRYLVDKETYLAPQDRFSRYMKNSFSQFSKQQQTQK